MNRHSVITAAAMAAIAVPFLYSGLAIYGSERMEYGWHGPDGFTFFAMSNHGELEFCNPTPFWTGFERMEIASFLGRDHIGSFVMGPLRVDPLSSAVHGGTFSADTVAASQHLFMTLDFEFDGGDIRLDPNQFAIVVKTDTPILGLIPYSTTTQMTGFDFDQMMNGELGC